MIGFINIFVYNLSSSQSIIALSPIYPFHKSLGHSIPFLATDLSQELSLQITMKSSYFFFNHLGMPTLQNSTQFSNANSLISVVPSNWLPSIDAASTYRKHVVRVRMYGADYIENTASSIVAKACLPRSCLAIRVFVVAGMRLPSRFLAMGIHFTTHMRE
jgi:hypothetical protein